MMQVFNENKLLQDYLSSLDASISIGFVPTMGALHEGHLSLFKRARKENEILVVSIFVNPTQFDNKEDLVKYPQTLDNDFELLKSVNCDLVFIPTAKEIYDGHVVSAHFDFDGLEFVMEGEHRKGHFDGVGTIVKRLFEIVNPDKAYFGEKDFQQLQIIKKLVEQQQMPVEIIGCDIYREKDGLAMSSRNVRLLKKHRQEAPFIYKTLLKAKEKFKTKTITEVVDWVEKEFKKNSILKLEYFEITSEKTLKFSKRKRKGSNYRGFLAVFAGNVRLIDNIRLN
jgi:pantoate--beta-alanine ligase